MPSQEPWDEVTDVVVVGTGAGGLGAAVTAASFGSQVLILEKAAAVGGTTRKSAAVFWIMNNRFMREAGLEDPRPEALRYLARLAFPTQYDPQAPRLGLSEWEYTGLETFYDVGSEAIDHYEEIGAFKATCNYAYPDYNAHIPENAAPYGRALYPAAADGGQGGGQVLIDEMQAAAQARGAEIRTRTRVLDVVEEDGAVVGVIAQGPTGTMLRIRARQGVVFASGGFTHNRDLRQQFLRGPYAGGCAAVTNTGDFVAIAQNLGAALVNMGNAWSAPIVLERLQLEPENISSSFIFPAPAGFMVNRSGRRFVNEYRPYHETAQAQFTWDAVRLEYPNLPVFAIWDKHMHAQAGGLDWGNPVPPAGTDAYWVIQGETWEELAEGIAERLPVVSELVGTARLDADFAAELQSTAARFNQYAADGIDAEFDRGGTVHETYFSGVFEESFGVRGDPNPTMQPLSDTGPYYAAIMGPGTLDTKGGPRVNRDGQVLRVGGEAIPGLYAVGNCAGSPSGQAYWAAGGTIGPIFTYAYLAGRAVSGANNPRRASA
ncbi:FAD-dependent oxidoreductase [Streptomyces sp. NPDC054919]